MVHFCVKLFVFPFEIENGFVGHVPEKFMLVINNFILVDKKRKIAKVLARQFLIRYTIRGRNLLLSRIMKRSVLIFLGHLDFRNCLLTVCYFTLSVFRLFALILLLGIARHNC